MNDRELLELAAKAAGIGSELAAFSAIIDMYNGIAWNPLTNDGDALRLASQLRLSVIPYPVYAEDKHSVLVKKYRPTDTMRMANPSEVVEPYGDDALASTRRAIVRAAAGIGKAMARSEQ